MVKAPIEKVMALTLREFQHTVASLFGAPLTQGLSAVAIPVGTGHVTISYEPRPSVRFGGLLDIPRALVTLRFSDGATPEEQLAFLKRFDFVFQRGGG